MSILKPTIAQAKATFEKLKPTLAVVKKPELALQILSEAVVDFVCGLVTRFPNWANWFPFLGSVVAYPRGLHG